MTARALTPDERKAWNRLRRKGYYVEFVDLYEWTWCKPGQIHRNDYGMNSRGFHKTRQAAIRDALRRNKEATP